MAETERLVNLSCELGRRLMENGAEIYRVEESMERLLRAYGCENTEVFAIPSCIILNIQTGQRNFTKSARVKTAAINLRKLDLLNALCRELCRDTPALDAAEDRLAAILAEPRYPAAVGYLAHGAVALFFTLFWGGGLLDGLAAIPCGLVVKATVSSMQRVRANVFFTNLVAGFLLALTRFAEVLIVGMGITVGVAMAITLGRLLAGY